MRVLVKTRKNMKTISDQALLGLARRARRNSYSPYSRFPVGAALLTRSGRVFLGNNVENGSYGLGICAERVALFKAVSEGERRFERIAIAGPGRKPCSPCGACRQVLWEFAPKLEVLLERASACERTTLRALLPAAFEKVR